MTRTWLFVDTATMFGGHEVMLLRWIEELQGSEAGKADIRPRLLARQGSRLQAAAPAAVHSAPMPQESGGRLARLWRDAKALRRALKAEQPERVIFASGALGAQPLLVMLARLCGARVLVYVPLLDTFEAMGYRAGWLKDLFVRWIYARVPQGWVVITAGQAAQFKAWAHPSGPVHTLPNTVAREIESAPPLAPGEIGDDGRLRVLVLGRLDAAQKGLDLLLDHLQRAPADVRDRLAIRLVGEGPYGAAIESRLAADPSLARCVTLAGWQPPREALAAADLLLMPSRYEGVPLVMLEAMALGLPVVGADLPGIRAHLAPEHLFPVGDVATAIERLDKLREREARVLAAARNREAYEAGASSTAFAQAVLALAQALRPAEPPRPHLEKRLEQQ